MGADRSSFDSRCFGAILRSNVIAVARPYWRWRTDQWQFSKLKCVVLWRKEKIKINSDVSCAESPVFIGLITPHAFSS